MRGSYLETADKRTLKEHVASMDASMLQSFLMAAKKTAKKLNKSDFIRSQPGEMSVADVIAKGKEAGIKFTSSLVYMVRGPAGGKATPKKGTPAKKSSSKKASPKKTATSKKTATTTPKKTGTTSKADFVRARAHLSPKEIVEDAKVQGVNLGVTYVYNVRGQDKATSNKKARASKGAVSPKTSTTPKKTASASTPKTASNGTRPSSSTSVEDLFRAAAAELGLGRAIEILQGERARVRAVLGG